MDKLLELISGIETKYAEVGSSFMADMEERNKKSFDHIALLKVIKTLVAEVKVKIQSELAPLQNEVHTKAQELETIKKDISALSLEYSGKKNTLDVQLSQQEKTINEQNEKIARSEKIIVSNQNEIEMMNDNHSRVFTSVQQIEREANQLRAEVKTLTENKTNLSNEVGLLSSQKKDISQEVNSMKDELAQIKNKANIIDPSGELRKKILTIE